MTREWKRPPASPTGASHGWLAGTTRSQHTPQGMLNPGSDTGSNNNRVDIDGGTDTFTDDAEVLGAMVDTFGGIEVVQWASTLGTTAVRMALAGYQVFPLAPRSKVPLIPKRSGGRGVLDATDDPEQVGRWWSRTPDANIGCKVPDGLVIIDIDPRAGGLETWQELTGGHHVPPTRTSVSGRGDGGHHLWWRHPGGKLVGSLGDGVDIKTSSGYVVAPPSIHPDTGKPYTWADPAAPPNRTPWWLARRLRQAHKPPKVATATPSGDSGDGDSIADWFCGQRTWADVLMPHGWTLVAGDGDTDDSRWRHPDATSPFSASTRHGLLFVYSPNTPLPVTAAAQPRGVTKFRAWALLDHGGDLSKAAKAAMQLRNVGWVK